MFRILHLSDLHIQAATRWSTTPILNDAKRIILAQTNNVNIDVVAFTGDIAYSGKEAEYKLAEEWLEGLILNSNGLNLNEENLMFVPGNHDVDRDEIKPTANAIEEYLAKASTQEDIAKHYNDSDSLNALYRRHTAYFQFCQRMTGLDEFSRFGWSRTFDHRGKRIRFDGFNSSWLCRGDDDSRRLLIGQPQFSQISQIQNEADIAIALFHHPLSYLMEFDEKNTTQNLHNHYDIFLRGHLHNTDVISTNTSNGHCLEFSAGALYEGHERENRFSIIDIEEDFETIKVHSFVWHRGQWIVDRNLFQTAQDGIGVFKINCDTLKRKVSTNINTGLIFPKDPIIDSSSCSSDDSVAVADLPDEKSQKIASFPRFQHLPTQQDLTIRQAAVSEAMLAVDENREVYIRKEAGSKYEGFIACIANRFREKHGDVPIFYQACGDINSGNALQNLLAINAQSTVTDFAAAIRNIGPTILILDDLDKDSPGENDPSVNETIRALLDFCGSLVIIRISSFHLDRENVIYIGALDLPDTREYLVNAKKAAAFTSAFDFSRVHRATGGLPVHLDAFLDAIAVTNLEGALAQINTEITAIPKQLPEIVIREIDRLKNTSDSELERVRCLLWILSILDRGETLETIKRFDGCKQSGQNMLHTFKAKDVLM